MQAVSEAVVKKVDLLWALKVEGQDQVGPGIKNTACLNVKCETKA